MANFRNQDVVRAMTVGQEMIDRHLVLSGAFAEEIKHLTELKAETERKAGIVKTLDEALKIKADADRYADEVKSEADGLFNGAKESMDKAMNAAASKSGELCQREAAVTAAEKSADELLLSAQSDARVSADKIVADKAALASLQVDFAKVQADFFAKRDVQERDLAVRAKALEDREKRLAAKLSALSQLAA